MTKLVVSNPWESLRRFTQARIALGRAGVSIPTQPLLAFQYAHARARDAVHLPMDRAGLFARLEAAGYPVIELHSAAADRETYLRRPDLGRRLDDASRDKLAGFTAAGARGFDIAFVIADGLSALAVNEHALPMLEAVSPLLAKAALRVAPVTLVEQGRVAIGDEIGEALGAEIVVVLIGERPGLSAPDSLGLYLTFAPRAGLTDEARNCISNVRPEGQSFAAAAGRLHYLLTEARRRKLSGVDLKDETSMEALPADRSPTPRNFLIGD
ncbi:MAG TPA: ethanolamine ammonia-lyase subunit EutC [Acidocella sp.]|jgi:ethanolamine ammonia-lyase small subunit|uniref:ethanolamine ammonia-lyase subunit EutC n=1 Tax=Acidocella sp. TaxID=50710 RepID=UPI002C282460|nr:ethanolamine ammonia-lyase subunit EutC [Acidocella sp.]HVE22236.1 ethanolamine ammonia-lyase subunit EutC [Acidocella sp.]